MEKKLELLKQLGFSDAFLLEIKKYEKEAEETALVVETDSYSEKIDLVCPDLTQITIEKTSVPFQPFIFESA